MEKYTKNRTELWGFFFTLIPILMSKSVKSKLIWYITQHIFHVFDFSAEVSPSDTCHFLDNFTPYCSLIALENNAMNEQKGVKLSKYKMSCDSLLQRA